MFQKIGGHELIARNRREDPKRIQVGHCMAQQLRTLLPLHSLKKLFQKIGGHELIARNRREDTKGIQVGQFYGPTVKNNFPTNTFKKIVSKNWRARANSKK